MSDQTKDPTAPTDGARLGERIRRLREDAGLTRSELGAQTGLSALILRNLEQGMRAAPSIWRSLLRHPSMLGLQELSKEESFPSNTEVNGSSARRALTVSETIDVYLDRLHDSGLQTSSILTVARVLRSIFRPALSEPLHDLYPERARHLIDSLATRISIQTRRPLNERTRRAYQERARAFLTWCVLQGRLPENPLDITVAGKSPTER